MVPNFASVTDGSIPVSNGQFCSPFGFSFVRLAGHNIDDDGVEGVATLIRGICKPCFWCQKDKNQNYNAEYIPLPRRARVIPKEDLPGKVRETHLLNVNYMSVAHLDDSLARGGGFGIMRDHDNRLIETIVQFAKHLQHDF